MNQSAADSLDFLTKAPELSSPVGLIAGNGSYPMLFAEAVRARGLELIVLAHEGEADPRIEKFATHCEWIKVGELGRIISVLKRHKVKQAALAGGICRVKLFGGVKLDLRGIGLIARMRSLKDDVLLRGVAQELERDGFQVISASALLTDGVVERGYLSNRRLSAEEQSDLQVGWDAARALGSLDIGQTVVAYKGLVVAVEAVEGTDQTINRGGTLTRGGGVVVKLAKPQQDLRLDLPAIGPNTIESMKEARATALVVEAGKCLILGKGEVVRLANEAKISLVALSTPEELSSLP